MVRVILNGQVIAETATPVSLEGNYYFPPDSVKREVFESSETQLRVFLVRVHSFTI